MTWRIVQRLSSYLKNNFLLNPKTLKLSFVIIFIIIIFCTFNIINAEDRSYLYKYSKLYNSYKFDSDKTDLTETGIDSKNCLQTQWELGKRDYKDFAQCGNNIIDTDSFYALLNSTEIIDKTANMCKTGYITLQGTYISCSYAQRRKIYATLLEFLGLGLGHLYIGKYLFFFAKFLTFLLFCYMIVCVIFFVGAINNSNVSEETYKSSNKIVKIIFPLIYIWYIVDIIAFSAGLYADENEQALY